MLSAVVKPFLHIFSSLYLFLIKAALQKTHLYYSNVY